MNAKIGFVGEGEYFKSGRCFHSPLHTLGDQLDAALKHLSMFLAEKGIECATIDEHKLSDFCAIVFHDMPCKKNEIFQSAKKLNIPCFLIVAENPFIRRLNFDYERYKDFNAVFSFEDRAVSKYGAYKLNYSFSFPKHIPEGIPFESRKFACMISSGIKSKKISPNMVSYERLRTIDFYTKNHPDKFDLFGIGWERGIPAFMSNPKLYRALRCVGVDRLLPNRKVTAWRGTTSNKREVVSQYKFSYCYENTICIPGYITEKLFDVINAGSVPVYLGAPETRRILPDGLYVDRADFKDDSSCYAYLQSMTEKDWMRYRECANKFVSDESMIKPFTVENYANTVSSVIMECLRNRGEL